MKRRTLAALLVTAIIGFGFIAQAAEEKAAPKKQTACPVMGGKINNAQYVDVGGKRIYVCCAGCIAAIKADPEKYMKKMEAEGVVPENVPAGKQD